jgi:hypothetical protein
MTRHSSRLALALNTSYSPAALCVPVRPHGIKTHPEVDQQHGGTRPFAFHQMSKAFAYCLNSSAVGSTNSHYMQCPVSYQTTKLIASPTRMLL